MFLFIRKILAFINIYHSLPKDYIDFKYTRDFIKDMHLYLPSLIQASSFCTNDSFNNESEKDKILFITHELSRTGAPKVALETLKSIRNIYGITPIVFSMRDGEMKQDFINEGFEVQLINQMPFKKDCFQTFCNQFKLIFVSSLSYDFLFCIKHLKTPVVWYSHEIFKNESEYKTISRFLSECKKILCGSPLTKKSIDFVNNKLNTKLLIYGIKEETCPIVEKDSDRTTFICPARFDLQKNQKTLIQAITLLPTEIREKIKLYIIGAPTKDLENTEKHKYYYEIKGLAKDIKEIEILPNMPIQELLEYYTKADCVVCPSTNDPMPVVVTYAFMLKKLALISNTIGQALLTKDKENAILFDPNDAEQLKDYIIDIVTNKEKYSDIAQNGRKIFDEYFSLEMFNKNLKENLDEYLL